VHGSAVVGQDTAAELLAVLIPGYENLADDAGHDEALRRRFESAVATAAELQETLLATPMCTAISTCRRSTKYPSPSCSSASQFRPAAPSGGIRCRSC